MGELDVVAQLLVVVLDLLEQFCVAHDRGEHHRQSERQDETDGCENDRRACVLYELIACLLSGDQSDCDCRDVQDDSEDQHRGTAAASRQHGNKTGDAQSERYFNQIIIQRKPPVVICLMENCVAFSVACVEKNCKRGAENDASALRKIPETVYCCVEGERVYVGYCKSNCRITWHPQESG